MVSDGAVVLANPVAPPANGDMYADISAENAMLQGPRRMSKGDQLPDKFVEASAAEAESISATSASEAEAISATSAAEAEAISATSAAVKARQMDGQGELHDRDRGAEATPSGKQNSTLITSDSSGLNSAMPTGLRLHHRAVVVAAETSGALGGMVRQLSIDQLENEGRRVSYGTPESAAAARKLLNRQTSPNSIPKKMGKTKNLKSGLGRALEKWHNQMIQESIMKERFYRSQQKKFLESTTDINDLDTIIQRMDDEETARFHFVDGDADHVFHLDASPGTFALSPEERKLQQKQEESLHVGILRVPRRPPWDPKMSIEELDANERQAFFVWRRSLASLEENEKLVVTPFEKNLDIWRQLWRVVERSDLLVMVVDARDPLFYRCPDLEEYAREVDENKRTLLLLNKADLLPLPIREKWGAYFKQHNILYIFWSAKAASTVPRDLPSCTDDPDTKIFGRDELLARLQIEAEEIKKARGSAAVSGGAPSASRKVVVGFVGFPNVGKSSTINALVGQKCTGVTATPGKTKHFQTLIISDELTLCDCPGLVFPSFSASKHDMIASGILPVDRMTDHRQALQVVANHVPRRILESVYNISLPRPRSFELQSRVPTASELLRVFCASRGSPDQTKAARLILKDYVDGKLLHYQLPPGFSGEASSEFADQTGLGCEAAVRELVLQELLSFDIAAGKEHAMKKKKNLRIMEASGWKKHHKKPPRRKDRSWRVGNDGHDELTAVLYFQKSVNSGPLKVG